MLAPKMPTKMFLNTPVAIRRITRQQAATLTGLLVLSTGLYGGGAYAQATTGQATTGQAPAQLSGQTSSACPAALSQMREHIVVSGDTVATVAATYRLDPNTLLRFNPALGNQSSSSGLTPGSKLVIPPFNGVVVSATPGETWQGLAERYGSRADLLFEVNGCVADVPSQIFVPGARGAGAPSVPSAASTPAVPESQSLGYPLANPADVVLSYGWQPHSTRDELVFNSGIAFSIPRPNDVLAAKGGTVAFTGPQQGYGTLVVINHADGLQTRYANLSNISVSVGQSVAAEDLVGQVGSAEGATFLYFEVRQNSADGWVAQDPGKYVPALDLR